MGKSAALITDTSFRPYYSHTFGCMVETREQKAALEFAHGVTPITRADIDHSARERGREKEKINARLDKEDEMYERHPAYAKFREMRARGMFTKHITDPRQRERAQQKLKAKARAVASRRTK